METPIGAVYSTNITPDRKTGIGDLQLRGLRPPCATAWPGPATRSTRRCPTRPTRESAKRDMRALYAYFMHGVEPVEQPNKASDIPAAVDALAAGILALDLRSRGEGLPGRRRQDRCWRAAPTWSKALATVAPAIPAWAGHAGEGALASDGAAYLSGSAPLENWIAKSLRGDHRTGLQLERSRPGQLPAYRPQRAQRGVRRHVRRGGAQHAVHDRRRPHRHRPLPRRCRRRTPPTSRTSTTRA